MYTIQTNASGTRSMEISEENLQTIEKYALFQHLIDSNGIVDESVLDNAQPGRGAGLQGRRGPFQVQERAG